MSERRKHKQSLFEQIALLAFKALRGGSNVSAGSFASQDPGTLLPTQWRPGSSQGSSHPVCCKTFGNRAFAVAVPRFWNSRPLAITESGSIDNFKKNLKTPTWREILERFWFQALESKILDPACCIRLTTSFDTFQYRPTMLDDVGSVWPGLYGLMKRYWKYSYTEINSKFKKLGPIL